MFILENEEYLEILNKLFVNLEYFYKQVKSSYFIILKNILVIMIILNKFVIFWYIKYFIFILRILLCIDIDIFEDFNYC